MATLTTDEPTLVLTPPDPVPTVAPAKAAGLVPVDDLEIRAWLDYTEDVSVDDLALVKQTQVADRS